MRRKRDYTDYGLWVKARLSEINMTQVELGKATGLKSSLISNILTGLNKKPENREKITQALQRSTERR